MSNIVLVDFLLICIGRCGIIVNTFFDVSTTGKQTFFFIIICYLGEEMDLIREI